MGDDVTQDKIFTRKRAIARSGVNGKDMSANEEEPKSVGAGCRVLSIQSHVVSGYVGNKSATFPLQVLGFEVDCINSVQFSNHTGYAGFKGQVVNAAELSELFEGLRANGLCNYTHILTGYVGDKSFLEKVVEIVKELKAANPNIIYVCDPVMGDNGHMYVPKELLRVYKSQLLPLADVITPNQFEAELLTGSAVVDESTAFQAIDTLHESGQARTVVLSSTDITTHADSDTLVGLASHVKNGSHTHLRFTVPLVPATFVGTGDLFACLLLAWTHHHHDQLNLAIDKTLSTMQEVLRTTFQHAQGVSGEAKPKSPALLELKLVQSKGVIERPPLHTQHVTML